MFQQVILKLSAKIYVFDALLAKYFIGLIAICWWYSDI